MPDNDNIDQWWESEGQDWWSEGQDWWDVEINTSSPPRATSNWGDTGTVGLRYVPSDISLKDLVKSATQYGKADELVIMLRYKSQEEDVSRYVQETEKILYPSNISTQINDPNALTQRNQLYFMMLRAYTRAKEGDFEKASMLWNEIGNSWIDTADEYRQPFVLANLYSTSLCMENWDIAMDYLERLWSIVKFMDANKRHAFGIWDEWVSCMIIHWIFLKHCQGYRENFCRDFKKQSDMFSFQKKILVLKHLNNSFISEIVDESYYNRARELNPELPIVEYEEKPRAEL